MNPDERLIELKRTYADMLLNTSKEAAARVSASELKAFRLEKELKHSKEQAVQMLVRLKKMMEAQVMEAEMISLNHQREVQELSGQLREAADTICKGAETSLAKDKKIEVLEAQLDEAEDIVKDLREELNEAHRKLERVRRSNLLSNGLLGTATKDTGVHIRNLNAGIPNLPPPIPEENTVNTSQPITSLVPVSHDKISNITNSNLYPRNVTFGGKLNERKSVAIPSILLKSKGPEFGGNRRTQRIRAFEEKLIAGQLSLTDRTNDVNENVGITTKEDGVGSTGDMCRVEKNVPKVSVTDQSWRQIARCKKNKTSLTTDIYNRAERAEEANNAQSGEDPSGAVLKLSEDREDKARSTHEREGSGDEEFTENETAVNSTDNNLALVDVREEDIPAMIIESKTPNLAHATDEREGSADEEFTENETAVNSTYNNLALVDVREEDIPAMIIESKTPNLAHATDDLTVTDNVYKYTFQRKRKRESTSSSDGALPADQSISKRNASEVPNVPLEMENCNSVVESSQDRRRRALVALQLVSLSDKKL